jgi:ribosomal protein S27E
MGENKRSYLFLVWVEREFGCVWALSYRHKDLERCAKTVLFIYFCGCCLMFPFLGMYGPYFIVPLIFISLCIFSIFPECNHQDATFFNLFISIKCSACFRRLLRPSSGAQIVHTASGISQTLLLPASIMVGIELVPAGFSLWSNECIHDLSAVKMLSRDVLPSFLQCCRWVVARQTCIALRSSLSACGIQCAQTFHFSKLLG